MKKNLSGLVKYKDYCESTYKRITQHKNYKLNKLIVFHRHGDRASLNVEYSSWKDEHCITCKFDDRTISNCTENKCKDGNLSVKGYNQMVQLGQFIKKNYSELDQKTIYKRCTYIERTQSSLHGVLYGLTGEKLFKDVITKKVVDDGLLIPKDCVYLTEKVLNQVSDFFGSIIAKDERLKSELPQRRADIYLTSLCNDIILDCSLINCDEDIINEYVNMSFEAWEGQAKIFKNDEYVLKLTFGRFVDELKTIIYGEDDINLISVHDSTLTMILAGMGADKEGHPPYASALFLEIWSDYEQKYLRVVYNDKILKTTIDDSVNIPLKKFIEYLNVLKIDKQEVENKCSIGKDYKNPNEDKEISRKTRN
ncbi:hypothetical protein COBT_000495 [Conglomerata obtusa]